MNVYEFLKYALLTLILLSVIPAFLANVAKQYGQLLQPKTDVGLIKIDSVLTDSGPLSMQLTKLFKDTNIKAIMLKIDCAGSSAGTGYAVYNEIKNLKSIHHKPIIALVENICTSGAYWIASATDHIIAPPTAIIGSIGATFQYLFELPKLLEHYNIGYHSITAGDYKGIGDPFKSMTQQEQALLQAVLNDTYLHFVHSIAQARTLSLDTVNTWANGKIFTGYQAKELGLIDQVGSLQDAIQVIKEKTLVVGDINWIKQSTSHGILRYLFDTKDDDEVSMRSCINTLYSSIKNHCTAQLHC
jgi:protease-4